jgi:formate hydrogenlyase subunit 4
LAALLLSPLLLGIIPRVKAWFAGRQGQPLFQVYYDLAKLLGKGAVYSTTTTWVFRLGPLLSLSTIAASLLLLPMLEFPATLQFSGDFLLFVYLFAMARFFAILTAMDTGSSFEGMGASREAIFATLTEPALFLSLATLLKHNGTMSLSEVFLSAAPLTGTTMILIAFVLLIVLLAENCRVPVDDPTTHLELTMIHEVMVLDNSGPDLAFITYTASLKLWITSNILAQLLVAPFPEHGALLRPLLAFTTMVLLAMLVGVIESTIARLRLIYVPKLLVGASMLALLGFTIAR